MWSKVFSPLLPNRLVPACKFPQLRLNPGEHHIITHERRGAVPLTLFDPQSLDFSRREVAPGSVVELRHADTNSLLALGFYEPSLLRVDVFHTTPKVVTDLPTIDEEFFLSRLRTIWGRRRELLASNTLGASNTYRIMHGAADGMPPLYVDLYSSSFARLVATSIAAERLLPCVTELLRQEGAEEVLLHSPQLGEGERLTLVRPTLPLDTAYVECGVRHIWIPPDVRPKAAWDRRLVHTAHRRARVVLRETSHGKRVLCVNDRCASATLNAVMTAKRVLLAEAETAPLEHARENLVANHGAAVFDKCETTASPLMELDAPPQDIVWLEHHPDTLSSALQWSSAMRALLQRRICGDGTVLFVVQDVAPIGIADLSKPESAAAAANELFDAICTVAGEFGFVVRRLRWFGPSVDYPVLPMDEPSSFSIVLLLQTAL